MDVDPLTVQTVLGRYLRTKSQKARLCTYASVDTQHCIYKMLKCRTGQLGGLQFQCPECHGHALHLNSCSQRACCACSHPRRTLWKERVKEWALNCDYLHVVFTLPHELNDWMFASECNKKELFRQIMKSAIDCLRKMSNRQYGCDVGLIVALHTWGQRLNRHVHVHVIMTAGGLSEDEKSWVPISTSDPQMQPQALADAFRKMYLHRLKHRHTAGKLDAPASPEANQQPPEQSDDNFNKLLQTISAKSWMVDVQATPPEYSGIDGVVNYLAAYVSGGPIGNGRMLADDGQLVTFRIKDYKHNRPAEVRLPGERFVERFADHVLPKGVQRVRYAGLFRGRDRKERLQTCCERVVHYYESNGLKPPKSVRDVVAEDQDTKSPTGCICKECGAKQVVTSRVKADVMRRILYHTTAILGWLVAEPTASIIELYKRSLKEASSDPQPGRTMSLNVYEIPLLEIYVLQEKTKLEAANASEEPEANAQPPPATHPGGRDAA